ncbi:TMEM175 family protein [Kitasatospora sp. NPDC048365]|uniref:TMEM175 family protein n=1 Tax=Kitasatospora sp. NPDC048365 TaxID=3364050 RepID=UPI003717E6BA
MPSTHALAHSDLAGDTAAVVALTLLALDLHPAAGWPEYAVHALGFLAVGTLWHDRRTVLARIRRPDRALRALDALLLTALVLLPLATHALARDLTAGTTIAFGLALAVAGTLLNALWLRATRTRRRHGPPGTAATLCRRHRAAPVLHLGASLVALAGPAAGLAVLAAVLLLGLVQ